jgi:signal transduction histidine kinase
MQVFLNLILNAEQAIREARDRGTLRIRLGNSGESVWASFHDDGPGIPADIVGSIFDPFYTTKRPGRGTGLGLSICKAVMKEHNGTIEAANAPGGGAVFTVTLKAAGASSSATS